MSEIILKTIKFGDIKKDVPDWLQIIPDETVVMEIIVPFGCKIEKELYEEYIGIILEGEAELYDISKFNKTVAYRPIRLLAAKEIFGDFSFLDKHLEIDGLSRPGETWEFVAGRRCFLLTQSIENSKRGEFYDDQDEGLAEFELFHLVKLTEKEKTTRIALLNFYNLAESKNNKFIEALHLELLKHSWRRAKIYRICINSYNFSSLLHFRNEVSKQADLLKIKKAASDKTKKAYSDRHVANALLPVFSDALFDALNSPLRYEPVFQAHRSNFSETTVQKLNRAGLDISTRDAILSASSNYGVDFYVPLDMHNYFINLHSDKSEDGREIDDVFPKHQEKVSSGEETKKLRPIDFYKELANKVIKAHLLKLGDAYHWNVTCISKPGATRPMLLLHFENK